MGGMIELCVHEHDHVDNENRTIDEQYYHEEYQHPSNDDDNDNKNDNDDNNDDDDDTIRLIILSVWTRAFIPTSMNFLDNQHGMQLMGRGT